MKLICKITNIAFQLPSFLPDIVGPAEILHPILTLDIKDLDKLSGRHLQDMDAYALRLTFIAYLYHSRLVKFPGPGLDISLLDRQFCIRWMHTAMRLAKPLNKGVNIPAFSLNRGTIKNLYNWLRIAKGILTYGYKPEDLDLYFAGDDLDSLAADYSERERFRNATTAARKLAENNVQTTLLPWAKQQLELALTSESLEFSDCMRIFDNYKRYPTNAVRSVRMICLTYLPESEEESTKKWEILSFLDHIIVQKSRVDVLLSNETETKEILKGLEEIKEGYSIIHNGELHVNSAIPLIKQIDSIISENPEAVKLEGIQEKSGHMCSVQCPTQEPDPRDYPSKVKYVIAKRMWNTKILTNKQRVKNVNP